MIEMLCIAAEITAVLLIVSIAIPTAVAKHARLQNVAGELHFDSKLLLECEESLVALRGALFLQVSRWVQSAGADQTESNSDANSVAKETSIHRLRDHLKAIEPLLISSTTDPVTQLRDRQEIEKFLGASNQWAPWVDEPTWVGLIQIDNVEQLDEQHGPVASELVVQQTANFLRDRLSGFGPLVRFNHHSFAFALIGWSKEKVIDFLEIVRRDIQQQVLTIGEATVSTSASASVAPYDATNRSNELWERLEDGTVEAIAAGANRGRWYDVSEKTWHPMGPETEAAILPAVEENEAEADQSAESLALASDPTSQPNSADSSMDAVSDIDIASLFIAVHTHRNVSNALAKSKESASLSSDQPTVKPSTSKDLNASMTSDDIATLFKAAQSQKSSEVPAS